MLHLSLCYREGKQTLVPIQDVARRQGIPQRYLEQVLLLLKRAGFLASKRGSARGANHAQVQYASTAPSSTTAASVSKDMRTVCARPDRPNGSACILRQSSFARWKYCRPGAVIGRMHQWKHYIMETVAFEAARCIY